jgi:hypothetical protein
VVEKAAGGVDLQGWIGWEAGTFGSIRTRANKRRETAKSFLWIALTTPQTPQYADPSELFRCLSLGYDVSPKAMPPARPSLSLLAF